MINKHEPIDVVIPWVDGADPALKAKLEAYLLSIGGERPRAASPTRFHNSNEIEYCVVSLLRFAPWINTIHIVTDSQVPALVENLKGSAYEGRVKVIDHRAIFFGYEKYLPTFNSSTILSVLWRIPDLAEQFIFLNDDFALVQPVQPEDFFTDGKVVLRGQWRRFADESLGRRFFGAVRKLISGAQPASRVRAGYLAGQEVSARILGFSGEYFQIPHNPHAWRVSTFKNYFEQNPDVLEFNIKFRLRSPEQFIGEALSAHLEIKNNSYLVDGKLKTLQLKPADQSFFRLRSKLLSADNNPHIAFVCVQNLEQAPLDRQKLVVEWLNSRIGTLDGFLEK